MQALEVSVNGKRICIAATAPNKVLSGGLSWTNRQPANWLFNVGGIVGDESGKHFSWDLPSLKTGDEVMFRLIETDSPDSPDNVYDPAFNRD